MSEREEDGRRCLISALGALVILVILASVTSRPSRSPFSLLSPGLMSTISPK